MKPGDLVAPAESGSLAIPVVKFYLDKTMAAPLGKGVVNVGKEKVVGLIVAVTKDQGVVLHCNMGLGAALPCPPQLPTITRPRSARARS